MNMESENNEKNPIGYLFGTISYTSPNDIELFVKNITPEQSFYLINLALKYSYSKGVFTLEESELISKSLRYFTTDESNNG